jgi:fumarate reductase flavoprotein subunit
LASGGFGANSELIGANYPSAARHGDWVWYIGTRYAQGDALELAGQVAADVWGSDEGLLLLSANFSRDVEIYLPGWLLHVDREGQRFIDETTDYAIQSFAVQQRGGGVCFALFDATGLEASRAARQDARTAFPSPNWQFDRLGQLIAASQIATDGTLGGLARKLGIDPQRLGATVGRYNRSARDGRDADYGKPAEWLLPLESPPFFGAEIRPAIISFTGMGPVIDEHGRVLAGGEHSPGLFAAGEATGGLGGSLYAGNGASVGNAVVFGRIAGASAAAYAQSGGAATAIGTAGSHRLGK